MDRANVVVLEQDAGFRFALAAWLDTEPSLHLVATASSGHDALRALAAVDAVDVFIMDLDVTDIDGADVARQARHLIPHLRILVLTGHDADAAASRLQGVQVNARIPKGRSPMELMERVRALVNTA